MFSPVRICMAAAVALLAAACASVYPIADPDRELEALSLRGHTGYVFGVGFYPDDAALATAGWDGKLARWDGQGLLLGASPAATTPRLALAVDPDSGRIASAFHRTGVIEIRRRNGSLAESFPSGDRKVNSLAFHPRNGRLLGGLENGEVRVWSGSGSLRSRIRAHRGPVAAVAWNARNNWIVAAERGPNLAFFESDGDPVQTLNLAPESLWSVAVFPRSGRMAVGTRSGRILLFDRHGKASGSLSSGSAVWCLVAAGDERTLVSGHRDGRLRAWDTDGMRLRRTIQAHEKGVLALALEPETQRVVSSGQDGLVRVFKTR